MAEWFSICRLEKSALFLDHSSPRANPDVFVIKYLDAGFRRHDELFPWLQARHFNRSRMRY
jgi:hypothetical protein